MNRKSERRARRQALNELLARIEPPSRLDELDRHGKTLAGPTPTPGAALTRRQTDQVDTARPRLLQQPGPSELEKIEDVRSQR